MSELKLEERNAVAMAKLILAPRAPRRSTLATLPLASKFTISTLCSLACGRLNGR